MNSSSYPLYAVAIIVGGAVALWAGIPPFFLIFLAVAYVAFRMLRKTMKMAFRIAIVAIILAVAAAGSIALWALGSGNSAKPGPRPTRAR